jgi:dephospho-CoA kinase
MIILTGYKEHGKDKACELLNQMFRMTSVSSSWYACETFLYDKLKKRFGYTTIEECYEDRKNLRDIWFQEIYEYNQEVPYRMADEIWQKYNIYNGLRNRKEFNGIIGKYPNVFVIWIDASKRKERESSSSMELDVGDANYVLDNNGTINDLAVNCSRLWLYMREKT